jgi:uncharacterized protein YndB with AHSA1/START domain
MPAPATMNVTLPSETEIVLIRAFPVPRELLFRTVTDPALVPRWWGKADAPVRVDQMEVRPGGGWRFIVTGPDGGELAFSGEYRDVTPPAGLVQTFEFEPYPGHGAVEHWEFSEKDGLTTFTNRAVYRSRKDRDAMLASGMEAGAAETFDRLDHLLAERSGL